LPSAAPLERAAARPLLYAYKRRLRAIVKVVPTWVSEEILSASEHIREDRAVLRMSNNGETCPPRKTRLDSFTQRRTSALGTDLFDWLARRGDGKHRALLASLPPDTPPFHFCSKSRYPHREMMARQRTFRTHTTNMCRTPRGIAP